MIDQNAERKEYERQIDVLLATDTGLDRWCWMRRRASKLIECEWGDDLEEIGSSDVSCKLYELWRERYRDVANDKIDDCLGWFINERVKEYI
jgi:hypothetical protein